MAAGVKFYFRRIFFAFSFITAFILLVCVIRTLKLGEEITKIGSIPARDENIVGNDERIGRFQKALQMQTISFTSFHLSPGELGKYGAFIKKAYPEIHNSPLVKYEVVNGFSRLYTIQGSDSSLKPYMLCAHLDVVPVVQEDWDQPAFQGKIVDGFIYGRGTLDDKHGLMGILEALEYLLKRGHKFRRTLYVAFGHDEEVSGYAGAVHISRLLQKRGLQFEFILDEGLVVTDNVLKQVDYPVALIGISEKGYMNLNLSVEYTGGHSSMPGKEGAIAILAQAVTRLQNNPQPSMLGYGPEVGTLLSIAPKMNFFNRFFIANLWLFRPVVSWLMSQSPTPNSLIRTTTAITMFNAGIKVNVLPAKATAVINHRIHPAQSVQEVLDHDEKTINDPRVKIEVAASIEAHPISPSDDSSLGYQVVKKSIMGIFKDALVAPALMVANTDTCHYLMLSKNIYRFRPSYFFPEDFKRIHGINERISVKNYEQLMNFFLHVMLNADDLQLEAPHEHGEL